MGSKEFHTTSIVELEGRACRADSKHRFKESRFWPIEGMTQSNSSANVKPAFLQPKFVKPCGQMLGVNLSNVVIPRVK
jgi:hypothetical protein